MATRLEDLVIRLTADNAELKRSLASSQAEIRNFSRHSAQSFGVVQNAARGLTTALAAIGGLAVFKGAIDASIELGDSLTNASERIGITAEELQRLQAAAEPFGTTADSMSAALLKFSKNLGDARQGTGALASALRTTRPDLLASLTGASDTGEAFLRLAEAIAGIEDPAERARIAQAALGRGGLELVNVLGQGRDTIEAMGDRAERLGRILGNDAVKALDDFGDALTDIKKVALAQFAEGLATAATGTGSLAEALSDEETIRSIGQLSSAIGTLAGSFLGLAGAISQAFNSLVEWKREQLKDAGIDLLGSGEKSSSMRGTNLGFDQRAALAESLGFDPFGNPVRSVEAAASGSVARRVSPSSGGSARRGGGGGRASRSGPRIDIDTSRILIEPLEEFRAFNDAIQAEIEKTVKESSENIDEALRVSQERAQFFGDFLGSIFRDFAEDGKLNLKELVFSFGQAIIEMEIRAAASKLFGLGTGAGAGAAGGAGGLFSGILAGILPALGFADGGIVTRPTLAMIGEGGEAEAVIPLSKLRGSGAGAVVNLINQGPPLDVVSQSRRRTNAGDEIDVTVRQSFRRNAQRGEFRDALGQRHQPGVG